MSYKNSRKNKSRGASKNATKKRAGAKESTADKASAIKQALKNLQDLMNSLLKQKDTTTTTNGSVNSGTNTKK